jgi:hypothetical protein
VRSELLSPNFEFATGQGEGTCLKKKKDAREGITSTPSCAPTALTTQSSFFFALWFLSLLPSPPPSFFVNIDGVARCSGARHVFFFFFLFLLFHLSVFLCLSLHLRCYYHHHHYLLFNRAFRVVVYGGGGGGGGECPSHFFLLLVLFSYL